MIAPTSEARELLDSHLDAVDRSLTVSNVSRSERRAICDELETQALDMLNQRAPGDPSIQHMRAVIAELDPPEAFCTPSDAPANNESNATEYSSINAVSKIAPANGDSTGVASGAANTLPPAVTRGLGKDWLLCALLSTLSAIALVVFAFERTPPLPTILIAAAQLLVCLGIGMIWSGNQRMALVQTSEFHANSRQIATILPGLFVIVVSSLALAGMALTLVDDSQQPKIRYVDEYETVPPEYLVNP